MFLGSYDHLFTACIAKKSLSYKLILSISFLFFFSYGTVFLF